MKPRFFIDVDQVLADFVAPAIEVMSQVLGRPWTIAEAPDDEWDMFTVLTEEQKQAVNDVINTPGWCSALKPLPGSQEAVKGLQQLCEVFVVTNPGVGGKQWVHERNIWLADHFGFDHRRLVYTAAKFVVAGDFFLDDNPGQVIDWQVCNPRGRGMLWDTEHNRRLVGYERSRVDSWGAVFGAVRSWQPE
jgi:5'(3')-deoxyribonucleotidase